MSMNKTTARNNSALGTIAKASDAPGFVETPLTESRRKELGIDKYYSPYRIDEALVKEKRIYWRGKRCFDLVCASLALIILSPIIGLFLLAIYIEDPKGSPIFKQTRVGKDGKLFTFYKMRSMCVDAEEKLAELMAYNEFSSEKAFKIKDDPRITKIGKFIRNTSIDELPQLVNIIKGDMSIVGPRPPLVNEAKLYSDYEWQRLLVTPGLTCFWQVYPQRHEISFEDWVAFDIKYVEQRSWGMDLKLIFKTVVLLFSGAHD